MSKIYNLTDKSQNVPLSGGTASDTIETMDTGCNGGIDVLNTPGISFLGDGSVCDPLSALLQLSSLSGNTITLLSDGLYASGGTGGDIEVPGGNGELLFNDNGDLAAASGLYWEEGLRFSATIDDHNSFSIHSGSAEFDIGDDDNFASFSASINYIGLQVFDADYNYSAVSLQGSHIVLNSPAVFINTLNAPSGTHRMVTIDDTGLLLTQAIPTVTYPARTVSGNTSATSTDDMIVCDTSASGITITVDPTILTRPLKVKKRGKDANTITITMTTGNIYGDTGAQTSWVLSHAGESITIQTDGTDAYIV